MKKFEDGNFMNININNEVNSKITPPKICIYTIWCYKGEALAAEIHGKSWIMQVKGDNLLCITRLTIRNSWQINNGLDMSKNIQTLFYNASSIYMF